MLENKDKGFIKIYRSVWDNPVSNKPNYIAVWIYLLSHANHTDKEAIINNKKITIKRGTFVGSLRKISEHYSISISTVKYIVDYFVSEHMIEHCPNAKFSLFKIKNYHKYNDLEHSIEHKQKPNKNQIKTTNKENKEKKINYFVFNDGTRGYLDKRDGNWKECDTFKELGDFYKSELRLKKIL